MAIIVVERGTPGVEITGMLDTIGHRATNSPRVEFRDVRIPASNIIGAPGDGIDMVKAAFSWTCPSIGAACVGRMRAAFDYAYEFAKTDNVATRLWIASIAFTPDRPRGPPVRRAGRLPAAPTRRRNLIGREPRPLPGMARCDERKGYVDHGSAALVDHKTWRKELDELRVREKAATKELDAIAAQRRRLPMVKMPDYTLVGAEGPVRLVDIFDGRSQLIVYNHMWNPDPNAEWQCGGCTRGS